MRIGTKYRTDLDGVSKPGCRDGCMYINCTHVPCIFMIQSQGRAARCGFTWLSAPYSVLLFADMCVRVSVCNARSLCSPSKRGEGQR